MGKTYKKSEKALTRRMGTEEFLALVHHKGAGPMHSQKRMKTRAEQKRRALAEE